MIVVWYGLAVALGVIGWSLSEYGMHHWNGHLMKGRTMFSREHLRHHAEGDYFAPASKKALMAVPVLVALASGSVWVAGLGPGLTFAGSYLATYLAYEVLHRDIHARAPRTAFDRWARKHHLSHHFTNPKHNHGVTSPLWDHVFRTYEPVDRVRVPYKLAMCWLLDPETDEVRPEHAGDYELRRPQRRRAA